MRRRCARCSVRAKVYRDSMAGVGGVWRGGASCAYIKLTECVRCPLTRLHTPQFLCAQSAKLEQYKSCCALSIPGVAQKFRCCSVALRSCAYILCRSAPAAVAQILMGCGWCCGWRRSARRFDHDHQNPAYAVSCVAWRCSTIITQCPNIAALKFLEFIIAWL